MPDVQEDREAAVQDSHGLVEEVYHELVKYKMNALTKNDRRLVTAVHAFQGDQRMRIAEAAPSDMPLPIVKRADYIPSQRDRCPYSTASRTMSEQCTQYADAACCKFRPP